MIDLKVKVGLTPSQKAMLARLNLESGGKVQQAIDSAVMDYNLQYIPWDTGTLARSAYAHTEVGSGIVIYPGPYAHYMYYGVVYGPNIPEFDDEGNVIGWSSPPGKAKHPTGKALQYSTDENPLAGSFWFERMKADHLEDIIEEAKAVVG